MPQRVGNVGWFRSTFRSFTGVIANWLDLLRGSYWALPVTMMLVAWITAMGLIEWDERSPLATEVLKWIRAPDASGTRAVLAAIAGSMITVTGVVFSITIVALTLASSQFGPRLLRNFLRDRGSQTVLGTFVSTFLFSLLTLQSVTTNFVPHRASFGVVVLSVLSMFVLIYFVHHSTQSIQALRIIGTVDREIADQLTSLFPEEAGEPRADEPAAIARFEEAMQSSSTGVYCRADGYVRVLDAEGLVRSACDHDCLIEVKVRPGDFVAEGDLLVRINSDDSEVIEPVETALHRAIIVGDQRTAVDDVGFLIAQLTQMAVRALSPGINDPDTAIACVHRLGALLARVSNRQFPSPIRADSDDCPRVYLPVPTFDEFTAEALDPICRYANGDEAVTRATMSALARAWRRSEIDAHRHELVSHARRWLAAYAEVTGPITTRDGRYIRTYANTMELTMPDDDASQESS